MLRAMVAVMATFFVAFEKPEEHSLPNRTKTARDSAGCVAHAGFEPAVSALRGRRPRPLDEWAVHRRDSTSKRVNCQTLVAKCAH
jgi:hypothetical protein